jgi:hypothetical protein
MYSTQAYLYQQITRVLMMDSGSGETFPYRYDPVYAKKLTINKGVDNVLLFEFINQEQKPVNITGSEFLFRVINTEGDKLLIEKPMYILNGPTGRAKVTLTSSELLEVLAQPANYSIQRSSGNLVEAVFVDAQAGARAPVDVVDSILPQYVPSAPLTIPTVKGSAQFSYEGSGYANYPASPYWAGNPNGASYWSTYLNPEFYSSFIEPTGPVTTVQMTLVGYTGTIKFQAAENYESLWYNVTESETYYNETRTISWNIVGWHPILRACFNSSLFSAPRYPTQSPVVAYASCVDGVIDEIIITNNGSGYMAAPHVQIVGDGAGATAEAVWDPETGAVTDIIITNGGSGYWRIPNAQIVTSQPFPVPPNNQGAIVVVSTGYVENLLYR